MPPAIDLLEERKPRQSFIWARSTFVKTLRERQTSNSELARRLGAGETVVRRMLDPNHATRTERIEEALELLGKRMLISLEDAALACNYRGVINPPSLSASPDAVRGNRVA